MTWGRARALRSGPAGALPWLLAASLAMMSVLPAMAAAGTLPAWCGAWTPGSVAGMAGTALALMRPGELAAGWPLMVIAAMPPLAAPAINHVLAASLPRRRMRAVFVLIASYGLVWAAAGTVLVPAALLARIALGKAALPVMVLAAVIWWCSPAAQRARAGCHRAYRIGLAGWRADRDCARQGAWLGTFCVATCWPWMLVPPMAGAWHLPAMAAVTLLLLVDRMAPAQAPRWGLPPAARLAAGWLASKSPAAGRPGPPPLASPQSSRRAGA